MAEYLIRYKDIQSQADALQSIGKTLASFEVRLNTIANAMDTRDSSMASLKTQIKNSAKQIPSISEKAKSSGAIVSSISGMYLSAEKTVYNNIAETNTGSITGTPSGSIISGAVSGAVCTGATVGTTVNTKTSWWDRIKDGASAIYNVGVNVVQGVSNVVSILQNEIGPGGRFEGAWAAVKTTTKIVGASVLIATSGASIFLGNPMGVLGVVYGVNSFIGAGADLLNINNGNYSNVGKTNLLKTGMQKAGEVLGENLGAGIGYIVGGDEGAETGARIGKSIGSVTGSIVYTAGGIYAAASVGNTVIRANPGNINNALSVSNTDFTKISTITKFPRSYNNAKEVINFVDAIANKKLPSYITGKIIGEVSDGLSNTEYGKHGLSQEAMKEILREPGHSTIETDNAGISDEFIKKGFEQIMENIIKPITVK